MGDLVGQGVAVLGGPRLEDVGDVDLVAGQAHPLGDHVGQELAGAADERLAGPVLVGAGASPMNISRAVGEPVPKTVWVRVAARCGQRWQTATSAASAASSAGRWPPGR